MSQTARAFQSDVRLYPAHRHVRQPCPQPVSIAPSPPEEEAHFSPAERARRLRGGLLAIASVSLPFWAGVAWLLH